GSPPMMMIGCALIPIRFGDRGRAGLEGSSAQPASAAKAIRAARLPIARLAERAVRYIGPLMAASASNPWRVTPLRTRAPTVIIGSVPGDAQRPPGRGHNCRPQEECAPVLSPDE